MGIHRNYVGFARRALLIIAICSIQKSADGQFLSIAVESPEIDLQSVAITLLEPSAGKARYATRQSDDWIRIKNRPFRPEFPDRSLRTQQTSYFLIQFYELPSSRDQEQYTSRGIEFVRYVPDNAVVARVPPGTDFSGDEQVRWIGELLDEDRTSARAADELKNYSLNFEMMVEMFSARDVEGARIVVESLGGSWSPMAAVPEIFGIVRGGSEVFRALARLNSVARIDLNPMHATNSRAILFCLGPVTRFGYVASFASSGNGWDGPGQGTSELSYFMGKGTDDLSGDLEFDEIRRAMDEWAVYAELDFTEISTRRQNRSIDFNWQGVDGRRGGTLAQAYLPESTEPNAGNVMFDEKETWSLRGNVTQRTDSIQVFTVALHEIGHAIGLLHSDNRGAIMYARYTGPKEGLSADDIMGAQSIYAATSPLLVISNTGDGELFVDAVTTPVWLHVDRLETAIPADSSVALNLSVNWSLVSEKIEVGYVLLTSNDPNNPEVRFKVTVLRDGGDLHLEASSYALTLSNNESARFQLGVQGAPLDAAIIEIISRPAHGFVSVSGSHVEYTPYGTFIGMDVFTFVGHIGSAVSSTGTVQLRVLSSEHSRFQLVNSTDSRPVDVYLDGQLLADNLYPGEATAYTRTLSGPKILGVADSSSAGSSDIYSFGNIYLAARSASVILLSAINSEELKLLSFPGPTSHTTDTGLEVGFFNEIPGLTLNVDQIADWADHPFVTTYATGLRYDEMSAYQSVASSMASFRVYTSDYAFDEVFRVDFSGRTESGILGWIRTGELVFVDSLGAIIPSVITTESNALAELPSAVEISSPYPNPLRDRAIIEIDLPFAAQITVDVYDLIGRKRLPENRFDMGAGYRTRVTLDTSGLAGGMYLARVIVDSATSYTQSVFPLVVVR